MGQIIRGYFPSIVIVILHLIFHWNHCLAFSDLLVKGQVVDTMRCDKDPSQTYAYYIPSTYDERVPMPIIYIFEPAARGKLPVEKYFEIAEKHEYILVCSNNSKNGPVNDNYIAFEAVYIDTDKKLNIDQSRIYTCGFSGGGRFAEEVAFTIKGFAGVIAVGGPASPGAENPIEGSDVSYVALVGTKDMNYAEHLSFKKHLDELEISNTIFFSNLSHQWASKEDFDKALLWLDMIDLYKNSDSNNASQVRNYISSETSYAESIETQNPMAALQLYQSLAFNFPTFSDGYGLNLKIKTLEKALKKELKDAEIEHEIELKIQLEFAMGLQEVKVSALSPVLSLDSSKFNYNYWGNAIDRLKKKIEEDSTDHLSERLLGYLALQLHGFRNQINNENFPQLELPLNTISLMIYPESVWLNWNQVIILYRLNEGKKAVPYLKNLETLDQETLQQVKQMDQFKKYKARFPELF
jgi:dienelactone hydrolase